MIISTQELHRKFLECGKVSTDTRQIQKGSIFFALKGANFNGNSFARQSIDRGASYAIIDEDIGESDSKIFRVKDCLLALQDLAKFHRQQFSIPLIAITGSNGKTTTKELLYSVLKTRFNTLATEGNLNNHIGVPLTLLGLKKHHEIAVIEMGANHCQEIEALCRIAEPEYGVVTNIGKAHLEGFGGIEGVIRAKSEMFDYLHEQGTCFVNGDDDLLIQRSVGNKKILYGTKEGFHLKGNKEGVFPFVSFSFEWKFNQHHFSSGLIHSNLSGDFHLSNLLCASAVGCFFGLDPEQIKTGIESYKPANQRSQWAQVGGARILLDTYNANPGSVGAAVKLLAEIPAKGKRLLILGDMFELGKESLQEHTEILNLISNLEGVNAMVLGEEFSKAYAAGGYRYKNILPFKDRDSLFSEIKKSDKEDLTVLLKGSRGMKMEEFLAAFY